MIDSYPLLDSLYTGMARPEDYYFILGVSADAKPEEIKRSYHQLALRYHPDKNSGSKIATAKFQLVSGNQLSLLNYGDVAIFED